MKIELSNKQIDEVTKQQIAALEKEVRSLTRKLSNRDGKISELQGGMDVSKEARTDIRDAAEHLRSLLEDAEWTEYDSRW